MQFKNAIFFRLAPILGLSAFRDKLDTGTEECQLRLPGPLEVATQGFVNPTAAEREEGDYLPYYLSNGVIWLAVGRHERILPPSVVAREVNAIVAQREKAEGKKLGGRARKAIKLDVINQLLPRALIKTTVTRGLIDPARGLVMIDTASRKTAEGFVSEVRRALGSFPALPLSPGKSPRAVLTDMLFAAAENLQLGNEVTLEGVDSKDSKVTFVRQFLLEKEVTEHVEEGGKSVTKINLLFNNAIDFVIDDALVLRKIRFLDDVMAPLHDNAEDEKQLLDGTLFIVATELGRLFDALETAMELTKPTE